MKHINVQCLAMLLVFSFFSVSSDAQTQEPVSFFPHAVGNTWRTHSAIDNSNYDSQITKDSVGQDGAVFLFYNNSTLPRYKVDTLNHVYQFIHLIDTLGRESLGPVQLWYKLEASDADTFYTQNNSLKVVVSVSTSAVFGRSTPTKTYTWQTNPGALWWASQTIAQGIGLIRSIADLGPVDQTVTGCIIDGNQYGSLVFVQSVVAPIPTLFQLSQNFPNPFNGSTRISFSLGQSQFVSLDISDFLGRRAAVLHEGYISKGAHQVLWDATRFASGLYICTLRSASNQQSIKLMLLK